MQYMKMNENVLLHLFIVSAATFFCLTPISSCHYLLRGCRAVALGLVGEVDRATDLRREYGDLGMTVEVVEDMDSAIRHIHTFGR